jgi:sugar phosphate isomerase/epimerase
MDQPHVQRKSRRAFLQTTGAATAMLMLPSSGDGAEQPGINRVPELAGAIGVVSASFSSQFSARSKERKFTLLELPKILRDELDMRVIDLNTSSVPKFASVDHKYLDSLRSAADKAGCVITNLKMNQRGLDMNSPNKAVRVKALTEYKRSIDIAAQLGCRWSRPLPQKEKPDLAIHVESYKELCDYGAERKVQLLVENFGWMQADSDSVVNLIKSIGSNVAAGVDTGNWNSNELRDEGLKKSFPLAATCDFKAKAMGPNGEHPLYDLKRCFDIAWDSGFRGPWSLEHGNPNTKTLMRELGLLREMLRKWTAERNVERTGERSDEE